MSLTVCKCEVFIIHAESALLISPTALKAARGSRSCDQDAKPALIKQCKKFCANWASSAADGYL